MTAPIRTTLCEVSVYLEGCEASRTGSVELVQGCNRVYIAGITVRAREESIRLNFAKGVTLGQIRVVDQPPDGADPLEEDTEAIRIAHELDDKIASIQAAIDVCGVEADLWKHNGQFSYESSNVTPADAVSYMEQLPDRLLDIARRRRELEVDLKRQNHLLNDHLKRCGIRRRVQWDDAPSPDKTFAPATTPVPHFKSSEFVVQREKDARYVLVELWAEVAGQYDFELKYWQEGATWSPLYEVAAQGLDQPVEVRMRAHVTQTTKEDWHQVAVKLRTGNPSFSVEVPVPKPWYIDLRRNTSSATFGSAMSAPRALEKKSGIFSGAFGLPGSSAPVSAEDTFVPEPAAPLDRVEVFDADRRNAQTMVEYTLPGLWDIESGVDGQIVDLERHDIGAEFHCYAFPRVDSSVYLCARIDAAGEAFPLDGEASTYVEGVFTGCFAMDAKRISSPDFELPFGDSDRVTVRRRQIVHRTSAAMLRNVTKTVYAYEVVVSNTKDEPVSVVVVDQVPVSRDESVVVEVADPDTSHVNAETGEVRWNLQLEGCESKTLTLEYTVSYPKRESIVSISSPSESDTDGPAPRRGGSSSDWFCTKCGARVSASTVFCPRCGARI